MGELDSDLARMMINQLEKKGVPSSLATLAVTEVQHSHQFLWHLLILHQLR